MLQQFIQSHGGLVATVVSCVIAINIALTAVGKILEALHKKVPTWIQPVTGFLVKVANVLSANTPNASAPAAPAPAPSEQPKA